MDAVHVLVGRDHPCANEVHGLFSTVQMCVLAVVAVAVVLETPKNESRSPVEYVSGAFVLAGAVFKHSWNGFRCSSLVPSRFSLSVSGSSVPNFLTREKVAENPANQMP